VRESQLIGEAGASRIKLHGLTQADVEPIGQRRIDHVIAVGRGLIGSDPVLPERAVIFEIGRERSPIAFVASAQSSRRNAGQVVILALELCIYIIAKDRDARGGRELIADLPVNAGEARLGGRVDQEIMRNAGLCFGLDQTRENIIVDILIEQANFEFERTTGLAECQVDRVGGFQNILGR